MKLNSEILQFDKKLIVPIAIIHLFFFLIKIYLGDFMTADSYEYYKVSENVLNYGSFYSSDLNAQIIFDHYTKRPPLYPIFILIFSFLLKSKIFVLVVQNILSILSISITLEIFKTHYSKINYSVLILFFITGINQFIYSNLLMSEILFQFLTVLLCFSLYKLIKEKKLQFLIYFQLLIVLLFLTKPVFYLIVIPNIILGILLTKHIKHAYITTLIPILCVVFYCNWNYQRTGSYDFSSIQNINLKNYNLRYFHTHKYGEAYADKIKNEISFKAMQKDTYAEQESVIRNESIRYLKKDIWSYAIFHLKGVFRGLLDPGRFDLYNFFQFEKTNDVGFLKQLSIGEIKPLVNYLKTQPILILILIPIILIFNLIKLIGFIAFWIRNYKNTPLLFWVMLFIVVYIVGLTGPLAASRFFVPITPIYLIFATLGISGLFSKKLTKKIVS